MPKGELTREHLSALLLMYLGTASDIVDFLTNRNQTSWATEPSPPRSSSAGPGVPCSSHSWRHLQKNSTATTICIKTVVMRNLKKTTYMDLVSSNSNNHANKWRKKSKMNIEKRMEIFRHFFKTEASGISVYVIMQDGPFVTIRLVAIFAYFIKTYTSYFFTAKNALVLALQVYRLYSLY